MVPSSSPSCYTASCGPRRNPSSPFVRRGKSAATILGTGRLDIFFLSPPPQPSPTKEGGGTIPPTPTLPHKGGRGHNSLHPNPPPQGGRGHNSPHPNPPPQRGEGAQFPPPQPSPTRGEGEAF